MMEQGRGGFGRNLGVLGAPRWEWSSYTHGRSGERHKACGFVLKTCPLAPSVGWCLQARASLVPLENPCNGEGLVAMCEIKLNGRNSPTALVFLTGCQVSCGSGERQGEGRASPRVKKGKKRRMIFVPGGRVQPFCGRGWKRGAVGSGGKVWPGVCRLGFPGLAVPPAGIERWQQRFQAELRAGLQLPGEVLFAFLKLVPDQNWVACALTD